MARADAEWVEDIVSAVADIRADTAGKDLATCSAKPVIVRSVLYSIAVIERPRRTSVQSSKQCIRTFRGEPLPGTRDRIVHEYFRTNTRRIWDVVVDDIDGLENALCRPWNRPPSAP